MAKKPKASPVDAEQEAKLADLIGEEPAPEPDEGPAYQVVGDSKIPVGKGVGKLWQTRRDLIMSQSKDLFDAWDEAISYFKAAQDINRTNSRGGIVSGSRFTRKKQNAWLTERENIVFANVSAIVPTLYAKAPEITIDCQDKLNQQYVDFAETCEQLINVLMAKKVAPGINLKPKIKKGIVACCLTNEAWIEVGYTRKEQASEQALEDLTKLADQLADEKDMKKVKEIEGKLMALEAKVDILTPAGPFARVLRGHQVFIDPEARDDDLSDANWIMYYDYVPTAALNAMYAKKDENGNWKMIYSPTHKLEQQGKETDVTDTINNFKLFTAPDPNQVTDGREEQLSQNTDFTKVWKVFDKTTRRVLLFHDKNWTWPIWVWDDELRLDRFFPLHRLHFHTQPDSVRGKGEVSYYLDQVDSVAEINDAEARARQWIKRDWVYNTNLIKDKNEIEKWMNGDSNTMLGINLPEGAKFDDILAKPTPDVVKFRQLFDEQAKESRLRAIDRISSTNDVLRGAQFKTNTTNKAIDTYNSVQNQRLDERIDAIEEWIGDIAWSLLQLCVQYMDQTTAAQLIGMTRAQLWQQMDVNEFRAMFTCQITGGSTVKPTSKAKKEMALELGQVLGQFVNAAPGPVLKIMLNVFSQAFDEVVMDDQMWKELDMAIFAAQQQGNSTGEPAPGGEASPEQAAIDEAVAQGVPPEIAQQMVMGQQTKQ